MPLRSTAINININSNWAVALTLTLTSGIPLHTAHGPPPV